MTPKEKAKELVEKFELIERAERYEDELNLFEAKQCALICVDEIIYSYPTDPYNTLQPTGIKAIVYWREVKKVIEGL